MKMTQRSLGSSSGIWLKNWEVAAQHYKRKQRHKVIVRQSQCGSAISKSASRPDLSSCTLIKQRLWFTVGRVEKTQHHTAQMFDYSS